MTDAIGLILLAAGGSARLGHTKQLLPYQGRTLLRHSAETALGSLCCPIIVVLGARAAQLQPELADLEILTVENADWEQGMGSSIRVGLTALEITAPNLTCVVLMLCDQPLITADNLNALVQAHRDTGSPLVASEYAGTRGVPALFSRALFAELRALTGAQGAKQIIAYHANEAVTVPLSSAAIDIDTTADYERLMRDDKLDS